MVRVTGTQTVQIFIDDAEELRIVRDYLIRKGLWKRHYWIDTRSNGVMENIDHHRDIDEFVREATSQDILIDKIYRGVI